MNNCAKILGTTKKVESKEMCLMWCKRRNRIFAKKRRAVLPSPSVTISLKLVLYCGVSRRVVANSSAD